MVFVICVWRIFLVMRSSRNIKNKFMNMDLKIQRTLLVLTNKKNHYRVWTSVMQKIRGIKSKMMLWSGEFDEIMHQWNYVKMKYVWFALMSYRFYVSRLSFIELDRQFIPRCVLNFVSISPWLNTYLP